jgi:hypothetical protein
MKKGTFSGKIAQAKAKKFPHSDPDAATEFILE